MPSSLSAKGKPRFINLVLQIFIESFLCAVHMHFLLREQRMEIQIKMKWDYFIPINLAKIYKSNDL